MRSRFVKRQIHVLEKSVDNSNFLWVTRGEKWGFRYLSKCSLLAPYIDTIYKKLFLSDENRIGYWKGNIFIDNESKYQFVACRYYDDTDVLQDEAGRRIPHEFLLLCSIDEYDELVNLSFGVMIWGKIKNQYLKLFHHSSNEVSDCNINFILKASSSGEGREPCESFVSLDLFLSSLPVNRNLSKGLSKYFFGVILLVFLVFCFAFYYILRNIEDSERTVIKSVTIKNPNNSKNISHSGSR